MNFSFFSLFLIFIPVVVGNEALLHNRLDDRGVLSSLRSFDDIVRSLPIQTDKISPHDYGPFYTRHLHQFRTSAQPLRILEIGLGCGMRYGPGASVPLWLHPDLFPRAKVELHIFEYNRDCGLQWKASHPEYASVVLHFGDQSSSADLHEMLKLSGQFDFIVDDGGHTMVQQQVSLLYLFAHGLKKGGVYFLEDYGTSSMGGYNPTGTATTAVKTLQWTSNLLRAESIPNKPINPELALLESISCGPEICAFFKYTSAVAISRIPISATPLIDHYINLDDYNNQEKISKDLMLWIK